MLLLTIIYIFVAQLFGLFSLMAETEGDIALANIFRGLYNLAICIPMIATFYIFYKILKSSPELKSRISFILAGLLGVTLGQSINGLYYLLYGKFIDIAFVLIIISLMIVILAFVRIPFSEKNN
jgi:hypothetical protein